MSELINLELLDEDAIYAANHSLDPKVAVMAWPECARSQWLIRYYQQVEIHERAAQAA